MSSGVNGTFTVTCDPAKWMAPSSRSFLRRFIGRKAFGAPRWSACWQFLCVSRCSTAIARVVTDRATIAEVGDVFVLPEYRGCGLAKWLMECVVSHPELQGLRRWMLATRDAHGFYEKSGFTPLKKPEPFMERHDPNVYGRAG